MNEYQETFDTWNKIARLYQDRFMELDLYNDTYDVLLNFIGNNASVLEIGCGPGNISKYILSKRSTLRIKGIDISENMITLARKNNPLAESEVMDVRNLDNLTEKFDAVICGFCIPYLSQPDCSKMIGDCKTLLKESGVLYLSFVAGDYEKSGFITGNSGDRMFFYFHAQDRIVNELKANSFDINKFLLKSYEKTDGTEEIHTILLAQKTFKQDQ